MSKRKILVTGGAGYIGSHTCKILSKAGFEPVTLDNLSKGHKELVKWGPLEQGNISDKSRVAEIIKKYQPEAVFHFAAWVDVGESVKNPGQYYENNVVASMNLLQACIENGVNNFVFSSTAAVYGEPQFNPITEEHPKIQMNPYGKSKWMFEEILSDFAHAGLIRYIALRYFNASGADMEGEIGSMHKDPSHLIPRILLAALGTNDKITVFGDDYPTRDGTCVRDYIHVDDLARAHVLAFEHLIKTGKSDAFNLGNGQGFSVKEAIDVAKKITGKSINIEMGPRREGDPSELVADSSKALKELGWKCQSSSIEDITASAWNWMSKQK